MNTYYIGEHEPYSAGDCRSPFLGAGYGDGDDYGMIGGSGYGSSSDNDSYRTRNGGSPPIDK